MQIIKHRTVVEDTWRHIPDFEALPDTGNITVSLTRWHNDRTTLDGYTGQIGLRLQTSDIDGALDAVTARDWPLIEIYFPAFTDGRGFSLARMIRHHAAYQGELRAGGYFLRDQLGYLARVGFDAFAPEIDWGGPLENALDAFAEIAVSYQTSYC